MEQSVFVRRLGEGERELLALHCTITHSGAWSGLAKVLDGHASFIAPDMLSHGRSPLWDEQSDFFDAVTQAALAELTVPMDVIGHSFGAMIALRLAAEYPGHVRSVVLVEPVFFAVACQEAPDQFEQHERDSQPVNDAFAAGDKTLAARLFNRMWSTQISPRWSELPERTRTNMVRGIHVVPALHPAIYDDQKGLLAPAKLKRASMPILLLSGSETHPVMPAICKSLSRRLPNARHEVVNGAGHMLPISHPQETSALLQEFWRNNASASVTAD